MKNDESMKCVATIMAAWPWPEWSDERVALFGRMISDLDFAECVGAIERLVLTVKRQPSVAEVRAEIQRFASDRPEPETAWGEVLRAISTKGMNRTPEDSWFSCSELTEAVRIMGWRNICLDENVSATRARFIDAYRSVHSRTVRHEVLGPHGGGSSTALPARGGVRMLGEIIEAKSDEKKVNHPHRDPDDPTLSPWARKLLNKYTPSDGR